MSISGFINVFKPPHISSNGVVVKVRGAIRSRIATPKVGHCGTLDPAGMGVLPIAVGKATKLFDYMLSFDKSYRAEFSFGVTTDSLDSYGAVTDREPSGYIQENTVRTILLDLCGDILQYPPKYSAKMINGTRSYDLARAGVDVQLTPKKVHIDSIEYVRRTGDASFVFDIRCSSGTYIRSICRDMATKLGTIGYMSWIIRTECHGFSLNEAIPLDKVCSDPLSYIQPIESVIPDVQHINVDERYEKEIMNGCVVPANGVADGEYFAFMRGKLIGLTTVSDERAKIGVWLYDN